MYGGCARGLSAAAALALVGGCSLLVDPQELCVAEFALGAELGEGVYQHLDLHQGTLSFWVTPGRDVASLSGEVVWLRAGDIEIGADADSGDVFVRSATGAGAEAIVEDAADTWLAGERHFVAVRWDRDGAVSPMSIGSSLYLHVDDDSVAHATNATFALGGYAGSSIALGGEPGENTWFAVDRLVILRRPVAAPNDGLGAVLGARWSEGDSDHLRPDELLFDVVLATFSEGRPGTCEKRRQAWTRPAGLLGTAGSLGELGSWSVSNGSSQPVVPEAPASEHQLLAGRGMDLLAGWTASHSTELGGIESIVVAAQVTADVGAAPSIIAATDREGAVMSTATNLSDGASSPRLLLFSTDIDPAAVTLTLTLGNTGSGAVHVHWIGVYSNLLVNPSFEQDLDAAPSGESPPWQFVPEGAQLVSASETGARALRIDNDDGESPHMVSQAPEVSDDNVYAAGASFLWDDVADTGAPGISVSNGDMWAIHAPFVGRRGSRLSNRLDAPTSIWARLSEVGKRKRLSDQNAHNSLISFGNPDDGGSRSSTALQIDSAYVIQMEIVRPQ